MPISLQNATLLGYLFMSDVIIAKLKHSFKLKSKHTLLLSARYPNYYKVMLNLYSDEDRRKELARRLDEAISSIGRGGKTRLAEKCNITPQAVNGWLKTGRIDKDHLVIVAELSHHDLNWLITGKGYKLATKPVIQSDAEYLGRFETWDELTPLRDDEAELLFFKEVEIDTGTGQCKVIKDTARKLRFSKYTLKKQGVHEENAACLTISGNCMEPVLPNNATIGIDTGNTKIVDGEMYAIIHEGHLRVKLIYKKPDGGLRLRSYNYNEYPDEIYPGYVEDKIKILGRVFWYSVLR